MLPNILFVHAYFLIYYIEMGQDLIHDLDVQFNSICIYKIGTVFIGIHIVILVLKAGHKR